MQTLQYFQPKVRKVQNFCHYSNNNSRHKSVNYWSHSSFLSAPAVPNFSVCSYLISLTPTPPLSLSLSLSPSLPPVMSSSADYNFPVFVSTSLNKTQLPPPQALVSHYDQSVIEYVFVITMLPGQAIDLFCTGIGEYSYIEWYRDGKEVNAISCGRQCLLLKFENVSLWDAGHYMCRQAFYNATRHIVSLRVEGGYVVFTSKQSHFLLRGALFISFGFKLSFE